MNTPPNPPHLSFAASNHCQRGSSARETSAQNERRLFYFYSFLFLFFCWFGFGGTQDFSKQGVFFDFMLDLFVVVLSLTLCDIDACMFVRLKKKKKNVWGIRFFFLFLWHFSVKTVQPDDIFFLNLPKHPHLIIGYDPSIVPFAWRKLFPKLHWLWFPWWPAIVCMCDMYQKPPSRFVLHIARKGGDQTHKRVVFFSS